MTDQEQQIANLTKEVSLCWNLLWLLANRKGGKVTFEQKELQTLKDGGKVQRTVDPITKSITLRAL